jgi:hypothetical protein
MRTALERRIKQRKKLRALIAKKEKQAYAKGARSMKRSISTAIWKQVVVRNLTYGLNPLDNYRFGLQKAHRIATGKDKNEQN